jgi:hypothetical protein
MPYKSRKHKKHTKKHNRKVRRSIKKKGGACGCSNKLFGGSAYLTAVPSYAYYSYNGDLTNDPQNPSNVMDARFMGDYSRTTGGKRRGRGRKLKIKGGSNFFSNLYTNLVNSGSGMNYINSFGAANGGVNQGDLVNGTGGVVNANATSQPVLSQPYGFPNPPLA